MDNLKEEKIQKKVDNSNYRERFQFVVRVNDNIICQRYFKINRFNNDCLTSRELFETLDGYRGKSQEVFEYLSKDDSDLGVVQLIQRDLESKSRIYTWATAICKTKMTGFIKNEDGTKTKETFVEWEPKPWDETEFVKPWEVVFKFTFLVDDKVVYEKIWDGSNYPKYVRTSVDLTNSNSQFPLVQLMNQGKQDLVVEIIKRICNVASNPEEGKPRKYTKSVHYTNDAKFIEASNKANESNERTYKLWYNDGGKLVSKDCTFDEIEMPEAFKGASLQNQIANHKSVSLTEKDMTKVTYSAYNKEYVNSWRNWCIKKYGPVAVVAK